MLLRTRLAKSTVAATMKDFPSCFGESGVQIADSSTSSSSSSLSPSSISKHAQNFASSVYACKPSSVADRVIITVTWTKSMMGQGLGISIDDSGQSESSPLCKFEIKPPWLFSKRRGHRSSEVVVGSEGRRVDVYWDLCKARFGHGPEPEDGFYLAVKLDGELVLLLGDMKNEATKKADFDPAATTPATAVLVSRRENIFGKKSYVARAQFRDKGRAHDVFIECDTTGPADPSLVVRVDNNVVMQVRRLRWKFRGNGTIVVDGSRVDVFWDVHNWLFGGGSVGPTAVFMFHSGPAAVAAGEKPWTADQKVFDQVDCSRDLYGGVEDSKIDGGDFSVILYAWKSE